MGKIGTEMSALWTAVDSQGPDMSAWVADAGRLGADMVFEITDMGSAMANMGFAMANMGSAMANMGFAKADVGFTKADMKLWSVAVRSRTRRGYL
jgi:hypothetical protein